MKEIKIVNRFMNKREFRNYVNTMFIKKGYQPIKIDDTRVSDLDKSNDNDILVLKDGVTYTVQTYLKKIGSITKYNIEETVKDMKKEKVSNGLIVTNARVKKEIKELAVKNNIIILDKNAFQDDIYERVG